jgi:hypothetical protein
MIPRVLGYSGLGFCVLATGNYQTGMAVLGLGLVVAAILEHMAKEDAL